MLTGRSREHDTFPCTISLSIPTHVLFLPWNCPSFPVFWGGDVAPWIKLLHRGTRQPGACHAQQHPQSPGHNSPVPRIVVPGPLGMGRDMLGQQDPYSENWSLSKNILLDKYSWWTEKTKGKKPTVCWSYICPYTLTITGVGKMKADRSPKSTLPETSSWWKDWPFLCVASFNGSKRKLCQLVTALLLLWCHPTLVVTWCFFRSTQRRGH